MLLISLLLPTSTQLNADEQARPLLASVTPVQFVQLAKPPQPPNYQAIKLASDARIAAEAAQARQEALEAAKQAQLARQAVQAHQQALVVQVAGGSCFDWMNAAGITDQVSAYKVIMIESGCNPNAVNASSGACGIPQALPCSKMPGFPGDPVAQLQWMQSYVVSRYGSWVAALAQENLYHWY